MVLNKSSLVAVAIAAGAAVTGASAQESPKVQSYAKNGAMNTLNIPMGNAEIGMNNSNGSVISGAITLPAGGCAVRLAGDISADQRHALVALGCQITADGSVIFGGSGASEKMPGYDNVRLTGQSAFVRVDMTNLTPSVRKVFAEIIGKQANNKTLSVTDTPYMDITTQDFATFVRTIQTTGVNRTTTAFSGGSSLSTGLGVEINVGRDGVMMASWHHTATRITGNSTKSNQATIGYAQYLPEQKAKASITIDTNKTVTLTGEKDLGNNWSAGIAVTRNPTTGNAVYGRLNYTLGGSPIGKRPDTGSQQLAETMRVFTTASEYAMRDVAGLGSVTQSSAKIQTGEQITDTQKVVEPPIVVVPPVKPPETPDTTPPTITLNGSNPMTLTVGTAYIEAGANWTDNKDGSGVVTTISGTVGATAGTYMITYTRSDASGNIGTATRTVNIVAAPSSWMTLPNNTIIDTNGSTPTVILANISSYLQNPLSGANFSVTGSLGSGAIGVQAPVFSIVGNNIIVTGGDVNGVTIYTITIRENLSGINKSFTLTINDIY